MEPLEEDSLYQELRRGPVLLHEEDGGEEPEEETDDSPTQRIDFNHLKFGKDYEID